MDLFDKVLGCIVGGAIGDALGGPYEGRSGPIEIDSRHRWTLSDDTQLTLATCEALSEDPIVSPAVIAQHFVTHYRSGRVRGVGSSTLKALRDLAVGAHWAISGNSGEMAAGNGAAMRAAPLAFLVDPGQEAGKNKIRDVSRITHRNEEAYVGALAVVTAVRLLAFGAWSPRLNLPSAILPLLPDSVVRDKLRQVADYAATTSVKDVADAIGCSGYIAESVPLAIFAAQQVARAGYRAAIESVISVGGDTDTNGSIAGQIAGSWVGYSGLPADLVRRLPELGMMVDVARSFAARSTERAL